MQLECTNRCSSCNTVCCEVLVLVQLAALLNMSDCVCTGNIPRRIKERCKATLTDFLFLTAANTRASVILFVTTNQ